MKSFFSVVLAICAVTFADNQDNIAIQGSCPVVPFIENFKSEKFVGKWFGIRESSPVYSCASYEIEETLPNHFHGKVLPLNVTYEFDKKNPKDFSEGMRISFKDNPYMDGGDLTVFLTDYENFAGTFICKESEGAHYQTISYWSRSMALSDEHLAGLDGFLSKYDKINTSLMKVIQQDVCHS